MFTECWLKRIYHWCLVQWGEENPNPRVRRSSGKKRACRVSHWSGGLEGWDRTSMVDSFSHIPSPNSFTNASVSLFEHGSVRGKWAKKKKKTSTKLNNFGIKMLILFQLRKRIAKLDIFIHKQRSYRRLLFWIAVTQANGANVENRRNPITWNVMTSNVACTCRLSRI